MFGPHKLHERCSPSVSNTVLLFILHMATIVECEEGIKVSDKNISRFLKFSKKRFPNGLKDVLGQFHYMTLLDAISMNLNTQIHSKKESFHSFVGDG